MFTSSYVTDSQTQFNESQKKLSEIWEASQKKLSESQKKLILTFTETFSGGTTPVSASESLEKAQTLQKELVKSTLTTQEVTLNLAIEAQKLFWDNYFLLTDKAAKEIPKN